MVDVKKLQEIINSLIDQRIIKILMIERAKTTSDCQFRANRKIFLNEFGKKGLKSDIKDHFLEIALLDFQISEREVAEQGAEK